MKLTISTCALAVLAIASPSFAQQVATDDGTELASKDEERGFESLFDGKSLDGWRAAENPDSFQVEDGTIVVHGNRAHLFYAGDVADADFKNFEFRCEVQTWPNANSGIYLHTKYYEDGWPNRGYECQVNNSYKPDPQKTASLYAVEPVTRSIVDDNEWFDYHIIVQGKQITIKINGETIVDYTEPDDLDRPDRQLSSGTFALQAHDPGSKVAYRNIRVKVLEE